MIRGIDHVDEITQGMLYLMFPRQFAVMRHAFPQITMAYRSLFERPFIAIGHDDNHRLASSGSHKRLERIGDKAFVLP